MTDTSFIQKYLPPEPGLVSGKCRVYFNPEESINGVITLMIDTPPRNDPTKLKKAMFIDIPKDLSLAVKKNDTLLQQRAEVFTNADGSVTLQFDIYRQWYDTGGYFTRDKAEIQLDADKKLKGFQIERFMGFQKVYLLWSYEGF